MGYLKFKLTGQSVFYLANLIRVGESVSWWFVQNEPGIAVQCVVWVVYMTCDWFLQRYLEIVEATCVCMIAGSNLYTQPPEFGV